MRNALIVCLWAALSVSACKLDTQGGSAAVAPACSGDGATPCDSGTATSSSMLPDAEPPTGSMSSGTVMTGRGQQVDASMSMSVDMGGSMASSEMDAAVTPPPPPKKADGETCGVDIDCLSGHCLHDICCAGGDCCRTPADCPKMMIGGLQVACNEPSTCQGKRGEVRCENNLCVANGDIPDDSACTSQIVKDCTPYKAVSCNGMMDQQEPPCPTRCGSDSDCVPAAHCDSSSRTCEMDVDNGSECKADHDCVSNHCGNGVCCKSGDCCTDANACFLHNSLPMCVDLNSCTGSVNVATCSKSFQCTSEEHPSMTACNRMTVQRCGLYPDVVCDNGVRSQCATSCRVDTQCKPEAYCKQTAQGGSCEPKQADGQACTSTSQCRNSCNHGFCCGDTNPDTYCCGTDDDCRSLNKSGCVSNTNVCDGMVTTATCNPDHRCLLQSRPDPNACTGRTIQCGPGYTHTAACPLGCGCGNPTDCSAGYVCNVPNGATRGVCQRDPNMGMSMGGMGSMP